MSNKDAQKCLENFVKSLTNNLYAYLLHYWITIVSCSYFQSFILDLFNSKNLP